MRHIEEKKKNRDSIYFIDGEKTSLCLKRDTNSSEIKFYLYRDDESLSNFDYYINNVLQNHSYDTRRKQARSLYLFYIFIEYSECKVYNLEENDVKNLINFLAGNSEKLDNAILITKRNAMSVSGLLSIIRNYLFSFNIENKYLGKPSSKKSIKYATNLIKHEVEGSLRYGEATSEYITKEEFDNLIDLTKKKNDFTSEVIIRMQYEYGFRIGEILGITLEDISDPMQVSPNEYNFSLVLRFRKTDKSYQHFRPKFSVADFKRNEHTIYTDTHVSISGELYSLLDKYISSTKNAINLDYCEAENLTHKHHVNYYIFISKTGHALSDQVWNKQLREYFKCASIIADTTTSKSNLNNRLRRGYIAKRVDELKSKNVPIDEMERILAYELRYSDTYYLRKLLRISNNQNN